MCWVYNAQGCTKLQLHTVVNVLIQQTPLKTRTSDFLSLFTLSSTRPSRTSQGLVFILTFRRQCTISNLTGMDIFLVLVDACNSQRPKTFLPRSVSTSNVPELLESEANNPVVIFIVFYHDWRS